MLDFGTTVFGDYQISSMPYPTKAEAYADIAASWKGVDCTTYFDSKTGEWYIVSK